MSKLKQALESGKFTVTCELSPPKGTDLGGLVEKALLVGKAVDAINLTDSAAARMTMDPVVAGHELIKHGLEPIVQVTSRDKNRLAIQGGMLGASVLGIPNLVIMGGDPPQIGDHPEAKGVGDLYASQIIEAAYALNHGHDHAGNALRGNTDFYIGSVFNPGAGIPQTEIENTRRKIKAGAQFLQTQAIYEIPRFMGFMEMLGSPGAHVLAGIIPIKSVKMANYMNERVPGIYIPEHLVKRIAKAEEGGDVVAESLAIAAETIAGLKGLCNGIHIMAIGWEQHINELLDQVNRPAR